VDPLRDKTFKASMERISCLAAELYDLMDNGMTIDLTLPERKPLASAGKQPKSNRLIVTKPGVDVRLVLKPNETDAASPPVRLRRRK